MAKAKKMNFEGTAISTLTQSEIDFISQMDITSGSIRGN